jgi:hypothetical protein
MKNLDRLLETEEIILPDRSNIVIVETNRWKPDKCIWIVENKYLHEADACVVFPFPELWDAICHIFVGRADKYSCYIHLSPLTSLFRRSTGELEKILLNLEEVTGKKDNWKFQIYYFPDKGREEKFRAVIAKVLGKKSLEFIQVSPKGYAGGNPNLVYSSGGFYYSVQDMQILRSMKDISGRGSFNSIPVEAIE